MSAVEDSVASTPLCQGFLKKRKDKIRLKWVTYWFKLHNTTLTFYRKEYGCTSDLKGQYYLNAVESVREVAWPKKKHHVFEITMKNGKRKVLAAETAGLRQLWMSQLLQAINQPVSEATELNCETAPDRTYRTESSPCIVISNSQSEANDKLTGRLQSAEPESFLWSRSICPATVIQTTTSNIHTVEIPHPEGGHCTLDEVEQRLEVIELENDYDVPRCKPLRKILSEEDIYETPPSNRRVSDRDLETTESIYDVPKYVLRKESVNDVSCATETPEITGLLHNMTCLEGNSGDWVRVTAPGAICQP